MLGLCGRRLCWWGGGSKFSRQPPTQLGSLSGLLKGLEAPGLALSQLPGPQPGDLCFYGYSLFQRIRNCPGEGGLERFPSRSLLPPNPSWLPSLRCWYFQTGWGSHQRGVLWREAGGRLELSSWGQSLESEIGISWVVWNLRGLTGWSRDWGCTWQGDLEI